MKGGFTISFLFTCTLLLAQTRTINLKQQPVSAGNSNVTLGKQGQAGSSNAKIPLFPPLYQSFALNSAASTSAGVFDANGTLLRTLWSGKTLAAGKHIVQWDGKDDDGNTVDARGKQVKILINNITAEWEGVIGNTSDSLTGTSVMRGLDFITSIVITGGKMFCALNYGEASASIWYMNTSSPQQKNAVLPSLGQGNGETTLFAATDGTNVYWAGLDPYLTTKNYVYATVVSTNAPITFANGKKIKMKVGSRTYSAIDSTGNTITGIAVQTGGNYLFTAYDSTNTLHVLNKSTGALLQTISMASPKALAAEGTGFLWAITNNVVSKYPVNTDGTLGSAALTLTGLVQPQSITINGTTVVVCDAGSSQQVKAYNTTTGASLWTLGTAGGYNNSPAVTNTKFYFSDIREVRPCSVAFDSDGSFWVLDHGNSRLQHFSGSRNYLETVMYLARSYDSNVDPHDSSRVFSDWLEFAVDYTQPIQQCWQLKNNWGYNIPVSMDNSRPRLRFETTLPNGRTYAALKNLTTNKYHLIELTASGVRFIGDLADDLSIYQFFTKDGSMRGTRLVSGRLQFLRRSLTGFDNNQNPLWGKIDTIASTTRTDNLQPVFGGAFLSKWWELPNRRIVSFAGNKGVAGAFHLGGLLPGNNEWSWRTAKGNKTDYAGNFPPDGWFDDGNGAKYQGNIASTIDSFAFWHYHGEFWRSSQTNEFNIVYQDGLFVTQFGVTGKDSGVYLLQAPYGRAGNGFSWSLCKSGNDYYVYQNDEAVHGGVHRWKLSNMNSVREISFRATAFLKPADARTIDLMADVPETGIFLSTGTWTRYPNIDSNVTRSWTIAAGTHSYNGSKDLRLKYSRADSSHYLQKDVGSITSAAYRLTGAIGYPANQPNTNNTGQYLDILDSSNRIIARFYVKINLSAKVITIFGNNSVISAGDATTLKTAMNFEAPFQISIANGSVQFAYDQYAPVAAPLFDSAADWQRPRYVKLSFYGAKNTTLYTQVIDIQDLKLSY
jgi:hypothetical protein